MASGNEPAHLMRTPAATMEIQSSWFGYRAAGSLCINRSRNIPGILSDKIHELLES
jgi:hypothetical protein